MIKGVVSLLLVPVLLMGGQSVSHRGEQVEHKIEITYDTHSEEKKNEKGATLLTVNEQFPKVNVEGNPKLTQSIQATFNKEKQAFNQTVQQLLKFAEEDYHARTPEQLEYWYGYATGLKYTTQRADDKVISFVKDYYEFTGGAHPNSVRYALNFDGNTGNVLTLKDVVKDEKVAREAINAAILKQIQSSDYKDYLFQGYEKEIPRMLEEGTWYLSDKGFVVISNEYIIGPHALGILEFTIPYKEATFLKGSYQL